MDPADRVRSARANVAIKREQTAATLDLLKKRLNPRRLARQALVDATVAGESAAIAGAETARRYPGTLSGLVALAGLFLARHRIAALFSRGKPDEATD
jgi:hypothetical protein